MGGGGTDTTTQTSGSTNPAVDSTVSNLLGRLNSQVDSGTAVFGKSLYPGMSSTTTNGIAGLQNAATAGASGLNGAYDWAKGVVGSGGYNPALTSAQSGIQDYLKESQADAPGYAALRAQAGDDTLKGVNAITSASGRFGSGSHIGTATKELGNVYAGMDMQNYENRLGRMLGGNQALAGIGQTAMGNAGSAASAIPGLYGATLQPAQTQIQAGQMIDADRLAALQGENDLFRRQNDAGWSTLGQASSILGGTAGASGQQTSTTTPQAPWWQQGLGAAALGAGIYGSIF